MSVVDYALGFAQLIVGVEPEGEDKARVYLGARYRGIYFVAEGEDAARVLKAWKNPTQHLTVRNEQIGPLMKDGQPYTPE